MVKEFAPITSVHFSPVAPFDFAVTSSARVLIYSARTNTLIRTLSRFPAPAHGASFRSDGKLLAAGDESGQVQIFDLSSRAILRQFRDHTAAVRATRFLSNQTQIVSASDDGSVRVWDIPSASVVQGWTDAHSDYVRCVVPSKNNPNLLVSGSYDHTVKLWDLRTNDAVLTLTHDAPVESVLLFPSDSVILSAAGNQMLAWDVLGGGAQSEPLYTISNHQKTITSLSFDAEMEHVLSGSLDQHVKIYNVRDYSVVHSFKYASPILSLAVAPDNSHMVVGMANGLMSIREKPKMTQEAPSSKSNEFAIIPQREAPLTRHEKDLTLTGGTQRFFKRGTHKEPDQEDVLAHTEPKKVKLRLFERLLKQFKYSDALDAALSGSQSPDDVVALIEELVQRGDGLHIAVAGRDDVSLEPIMKFILRHILEPDYTIVLSYVLDIILDIYSSVIHSSPRSLALLKKIRQKTTDEVRFQTKLHELKGMLEMVQNFSRYTLHE